MELLSRMVALEVAIDDFCKSTSVRYGYMTMIRYSV